MVAAGDADVVVDGIGQVLEWGEWWLLTYADCGHETMFSRTAHRLFEWPEVERVVRKSYAERVICSGPQPAIHRRSGRRCPSLIR
jgi:hypothetical protein